MGGMDVAEKDAVQSGGSASGRGSGSNCGSGGSGSGKSTWARRRPNLRDHCGSSGNFAASLPNSTSALDAPPPLPQFAAPAPFPQPSAGSAPTAATRDLGAGASAAGAAGNRVTAATRAAAAGGDGSAASAGRLQECSTVWSGPVSLIEWSTSDVCSWLIHSVGFPDGSGREYARDFDQHQVDGLSLASITHSHPALARLMHSPLFPPSPFFLPPLPQNMHGTSTSTRWTVSHSLASHHTLPPLSSPPSSSLFPPEYARDFDQHQVDGLSLVGITHSHPALARMRLADYTLFESHLHQLVTAEAAAPPAPHHPPPPLSTVDFSVSTAPATAAAGGSAVLSGGGAAANSRVGVGAVRHNFRHRRTSSIGASIISDLLQKRTNTAGGAGEGRAAAVQSLAARISRQGSGVAGAVGGWFAGWGSRQEGQQEAEEEGERAQALEEKEERRRHSKGEEEGEEGEEGEREEDGEEGDEEGEVVAALVEEVVCLRGEVTAAEERECTVKAQLCHLDDLLKESLLVEYLPTRTVSSRHARTAFALLFSIHLTVSSRHVSFPSYSFSSTPHTLLYPQIPINPPPPFLPPSLFHMFPLPPFFLFPLSPLPPCFPSSQKWASTPNDPPTLNPSNTTEEDEWVPRFVTLTPTDIACYLHATDLHPQITLPVASIASAGTLRMAPAPPAVAPAAAKETSAAVASSVAPDVAAPLSSSSSSASSSEEWFAFHVTTSYGFKLECATRSCAKESDDSAHVSDSEPRKADTFPYLVTVVTVGAESATSSSLPTTPPASPPASLAAFLPAAGRLPVTSSGRATPSVKGKVFLRYVARLTPPRSNGKVVGDRGATGKVIMKGMK
ncbi:unnamed protein product [Closterium sp. Naga37s-1]|nr:unnamed protein product [Closterium sp. Naga37s-1]